MYRYRHAWLLVVVGLFQGCNINGPADDGNGRDNLPTVPGLRAFQSESELHDYMMGQVVARSATMGTNMSAPGRGDQELALDSSLGAGGAASEGPAPQLAAPPVDADVGSVGEGHSGTTIQEAGVDEADVVKTDGQFLYVMTQDKLKIVRVSPLESLAEVALNGWGRDLYLHGDKVVALTEPYENQPFDGGVAVPPDIVDEPFPADDIASGGGSEPSMGPDAVNSPGRGMMGGMMDGDAGMSVDDIGWMEAESGIKEPAADIGLIAPSFYYRPRTAVTIIDVSDPANPTNVAEYRFDGWQASSRMIDGVLRLVVSNYQYYYFDVMPMMGRADADYSAVDPTLLIPKYEYTDASGNRRSGDVAAWDRLYRPEDADGFGLMALISLDVDNSDSFTAVGLVAEPGLIYSSTEALYVTNTEWDYLGGHRTTTNIYKFDYTDDGAVPAAAGSVPGRVLNQYSMSEHNGNLRVATTIDPIWSNTGTVTRSTNSVYVLQVRDDALSVAGSIEDIAPGESIQAARFLGDRGYLVTFEQVDPLFTLDLADPTAPKIVGELKVPGFSTFIVPLDQNHLLTVGQYIPETQNDFDWRPWGVQLSIFDVTDFANPTLKHSVVLGEEAGAWSEAMWNPKAFTYYAEEGLLALPVSIQEQETSLGPLAGLIEPGVVVAEDGQIHFDVVVSLDENGEPVDVLINGQSLEELSAAWVPPGFDGLVVYEVSADNGFTEKGRISTRFLDQGHHYSAFTRGVFVGDHVYAVTDGGVRGAALSDVGTVTSEVYYGYVYEPWTGIWSDELIIDNLGLGTTGAEGDIAR